MVWRGRRERKSARGRRPVGRSAFAGAVGGSPGHYRPTRAPISPAERRRLSSPPPAGRRLIWPPKPRPESPSRISEYRSSASGGDICYFPPAPIDVSFYGHAENHPMPLVRRQRRRCGEILLLDLQELEDRQYPALR